jgi:glucose/arabinose dehydrogenase
VQGLALQPGTGDVFAIEHGPQGGDEINHLLPGRNYGWPRVSHGCEYGTPVDSCTPVGGARTGHGLEDPVSVWAPEAIAPSGATFYRGDRFPEWRGDLLIGALAGKALWRVRLRGAKVLSREKMFESLDERIRDVREGPDGWLYLLTDNRAGRILRIER